MSEESKNTETENGEPSRKKNVLEEIGDTVEQLATKTFDSIKRTIDKTMTSRNTVLTIRVSDDTNEKLNTLVEAGLFKSRSESAAFLIAEGIKKQRTLFKKISDKMEDINRLRDELKGIITEEMAPKTSKK